MYFSVALWFSYDLGKCTRAIDKDKDQTMSLMRRENFTNTITYKGWGEESIWTIRDINVYMTGKGKGKSGLAGCVYNKYQGQIEEE